VRLGGNEMGLPAKVLGNYMRAIVQLSLQPVIDTIPSGLIKTGQYALGLPRSSSV
jgi:hypothetical protein